jgi:hypothetical protein
MKNLVKQVSTDLDNDYNHTLDNCHTFDHTLEHRVLWTLHNGSVPLCQY